MPEQGMVTEVSVDEQGSELTAALTIGDALVYVEDVGVYDTSGGTIQVNGSRFDYDSADTDAGTLSVGGSGSPVAGDIGDVVSVIFGGEIAYDYTLLVMLSEGEPIYVPIAYGDRTLWPNGPVDPPIPVSVSDDLSTVLDVPGRQPSIEQDFVMRGGKILSQTGDGVTTTAIGPIGTELGFPTSTYAGLLVKTALGNGMLEAFARVDTPTDGGLVYIGDPFSSIQPRANFNVRDFSLTAGTGSGGFSTDGIQLVNSLTNSQIHIAAGFGIFCSTGSDHMFTITDDTGNAGLGFTANAANMNISTVDGSVCRVTSSRRYKQNIKPARIDVQAVLALQPKQFRTKAEVKKFGKDAPVHVGVIAEEAADLGLDAWVEHDKDGPEAFAYANFSIALLAVAQDQAKRIDALEKRLAALESGDR